MIMFFRRTGLALLASLAFSSYSSGQVLFEMGLTNFAEVGFTYDTFASGFAVENDYFTIDVTGFGGAGVNTNFEEMFPNFTNQEAFIEVEIRVGANNESTDVRIILADEDGFAANGGRIVEDYQYTIDLTSLPAGATDFSVVEISLDSFVFNDTSFQSEPTEDMATTNYGLFQVQIQSVFPESGNSSDVTPRTDVDIRRVTLVTGQATVVDVLGDFNDDLVVDCADLDGYIGNIGAAATGALVALDIDGDGTLTAADADTHITTLVVTSNGVTGTFAGDLNCDGAVNVLGDAFALVGSLGSSVTTYAEGDINFDGTVNVLGDAFALVGNLGQSNGP